MYNFDKASENRWKGKKTKTKRGRYYFGFQLPIEVYEELQALSKLRYQSMTSIIIGLIRKEYKNEHHE